MMKYDRYLKFRQETYQMLGRMSGVRAWRDASSRNSSDFVNMLVVLESIIGIDLPSRDLIGLYPI
jgi:hypothetical protein